jgi:hypothetical protein
VLVSVNAEGEQVSGQDDQVTTAILVEAGRFTAARLRAEQQAGAVFALGWVMAELFDPRRRVSVTVRQPPFDPDSQLPQVADLAADPKLVLLAAELAEYLHWFPHLATALRPVSAQASRMRSAVERENEAVAEAAARADAAGQPDDVARPPDDGAEAASAAVAARAPLPAAGFLDAVTELNQAILDEFADDPERLSCYQLGLALSDLVWIPSAAADGRPSAASRPSALFGLFARPHLATVQTLLNGAGRQLPAGAAAIVSRSLDNWADWVDVNSARLRPPAAGGSPAADEWSPEAGTVLRALRVQGWIWRSVLIAAPEMSVQPGMGAWVQAGSSIARAARMTAEVIIRRFWPLVLIGLAALAGLLYLAIANLSGASQVWTSLATVAVVVGSGTWGLSSGVSSALSGVGYDIWSAAKLDAAAWNVTWLPPLNATAGERIAMERRGVAAPQLRKNLDAS